MIKIGVIFFVQEPIFLCQAEQVLIFLGISDAKFQLVGS